MPSEFGAQLPALAAVLAIADEACALVLSMLKHPLKHRQKSDDSPVTVIDEAVDALLTTRLRALFPPAAWLSEETKDNAERLSAAWLWVVDPIDGTKSLLAGEPEFCVSIALVRSGVGPLLAVVANPMTAERFVAEKGHGARDETDSPLHVRPTFDRNAMIFLASRTDLGQGQWATVWPPAALRPMGSLAYKMALVAAGKADGHATLGPRSEWDAAAGALLIAEAGGQVADIAGDPLRFNQPVPLFNGLVVASATAFSAVMAAAVAQKQLQRHRSQ
ncbi:MAG: 3'(2'),5'-bisphosphate nucleotidase CysQ [Myxococcales bacterium]|nr:3'(2'),5'-bisphosphate nucleotidase CysQ [Myxococcales bacterium]